MAGNRRKRYLLLLGLGALALLLYLGRPSAQILPKEELETMWIERMLDGHSEDVHFIMARGEPRIASPATVVHGYPGGLRQFPKAVRILDTSGSYLWGLVGLSGGGGWRLEGGLLEEVALPAGDALELFLMKVTYVHPALMPLWMKHFRQSGVSFKLFLVRRDRSGRKTEILQTWDIAAGRVQWRPPQNNILTNPITTASLAHDEAQKRATVTITGIDRDITAHIDIDVKTR